jgi:hypothetical protein
MATEGNVQFGDWKSKADFMVSEETLKKHVAAEINKYKHKFPKRDKGQKKKYWKRIDDVLKSETKGATLPVNYTGAYSGDSISTFGAVHLKGVVLELRSGHVSPSKLDVYHLLSGGVSGEGGRSASKKLSSSETSPGEWTEDRIKDTVLERVEAALKRTSSVYLREAMTAGGKYPAVLKMVRDCDKYAPPVHLELPNIYVGNYKEETDLYEAYGRGELQKDPVAIVSNGGSPKSSFNRGDLLDDVEEGEDPEEAEDEKEEEGFGKRGSAAITGKPLLSIYDSCLEVEQNAKRDAGKKETQELRGFQKYQWFLWDKMVILDDFNGITLDLFDGELYVEKKRTSTTTTASKGKIELKSDFHVNNPRVATSATKGEKKVIYGLKDAIEKEHREPNGKLADVTYHMLGIFANSVADGVAKTSSEKLTFSVFAMPVLISLFRPRNEARSKSSVSVEGLKVSNLRNRFDYEHSYLLGLLQRFYGEGDVQRLGKWAKSEGTKVDARSKARDEAIAEDVEFYANMTDEEFLAFSESVFYVVENLPRAGLNALMQKCIRFRSRYVDLGVFSPECVLPDSLEEREGRGRVFTEFVLACVVCAHAMLPWSSDPTLKRAVGGLESACEKLASCCLRDASVSEAGEDVKRFLRARTRSGKEGVFSPTNVSGSVQEGHLGQTSSDWIWKVTWNDIIILLGNAVFLKRARGSWWPSLNGFRKIVSIALNAWACDKAYDWQDKTEEAKLKLSEIQVLYLNAQAKDDLERARERSEESVEDDDDEEMEENKEEEKKRVAKKPETASDWAKEIVPWSRLRAIDETFLNVKADNIFARREFYGNAASYFRDRLGGTQSDLELYRRIAILNPKQKVYKSRLGFPYVSSHFTAMGIELCVDNEYVPDLAKFFVKNDLVELRANTYEASRRGVVLPRFFAGSKGYPYLFKVLDACHWGLNPRLTEGRLKSHFLRSNYPDDKSAEIEGWADPLRRKCKEIQRVVLINQFCSHPENFAASVSERGRRRQRSSVSGTTISVTTTASASDSRIKGALFVRLPRYFTNKQEAPIYSGLGMEKFDPFFRLNRSDVLEQGEDSPATKKLKKTSKDEETRLSQTAIIEPLNQELIAGLMGSYVIMLRNEQAEADRRATYSLKRATRAMEREYPKPPETKGRRRLAKRLGSFFSSFHVSKEESEGGEEEQEEEEAKTRKYKETYPVPRVDLTPVAENPATFFVSETRPDPRKKDNKRMEYALEFFNEMVCFSSMEMTLPTKVVLKERSEKSGPGKTAGKHVRLLPGLPFDPDSQLGSDSWPRTKDALHALFERVYAGSVADSEDKTVSRFSDVLILVAEYIFNKTSVLVPVDTDMYGRPRSRYENDGISFDCHWPTEEKIKADEEASKKSGGENQKRWIKEAFFNSKGNKNVNPFFLDKIRDFDVWGRNFSNYLSRGGSGARKNPEKVVAKWCLVNGSFLGDLVFYQLWQNEDVHRYYEFLVREKSPLPGPQKSSVSAKSEGESESTYETFHKERRFFENKFFMFGVRNAGVSVAASSTSEEGDFEMEKTERYEPVDLSKTTWDDEWLAEQRRRTPKKTFSAEGEDRDEDEDEGGDKTSNVASLETYLKRFRALMWRTLVNSPLASKRYQINPNGYVGMLCLNGLYFMRWYDLFQSKTSPWMPRFYPVVQAADSSQYSLLTAPSLLKIVPTSLSVERRRHLDRILENSKKVLDHYRKMNDKIVYASYAYFSLTFNSDPFVQGREIRQLDYGLRSGEWNVDVVRRAYLRFFSICPVNLMLTKINREGNGVEKVVSPYDGDTFSFLIHLTQLFPGAFDKTARIAKALGHFVVFDRILYSHVRRLLSDLVSKHKDPEGPGSDLLSMSEGIVTASLNKHNILPVERVTLAAWWPERIEYGAIIGDYDYPEEEELEALKIEKEAFENRKNMAHQTSIITKMVSNKNRTKSNDPLARDAHFINMPVGSGKTGMVMGYLSELLNTGELSKTIVYSTPTDPVPTLIKELRAYGFCINLVTTTQNEFPYKEAKASLLLKEKDKDDDDDDEGEERSKEAKKKNVDQASTFNSGIVKIWKKAGVYNGWFTVNGMEEVAYAYEGPKKMFLENKSKKKELLMTMGAGQEDAELLSRFMPYVVNVVHHDHLRHISAEAIQMLADVPAGNTNPAYAAEKYNLNGDYAFTAKCRRGGPGYVFICDEVHKLNVSAATQKRHAGLNLFEYSNHSVALTGTVIVNKDSVINTVEWLRPMNAFPINSENVWVAVKSQLTEPFEDDLIRKKMVIDLKRGMVSRRADMNDWDELVAYHLGKRSANDLEVIRQYEKLCFFDPERGLAGDETTQDVAFIKSPEGEELEYLQKCASIEKKTKKGGFETLFDPKTNLFYFNWGPEEDEKRKLIVSKMVENAGAQKELGRELWKKYEKLCREKVIMYRTLAEAMNEVLEGNRVLVYTSNAAQCELAAKTLLATISEMKRKHKTLRENPRFFPNPKFNVKSSLVGFEYTHKEASEDEAKQKDHKVTFMTMKSVEGFNFSAANVTITSVFPQSLASEIQAEGRIARTGQRRPEVKIIYVLTYGLTDWYKKKVQAKGDAARIQAENSKFKSGKAGNLSFAKGL